MFMKRNAKWGCILRYLQAEIFILQKEYAIWKSVASPISKHLKISLICNVAVLTQFSFNSVTNHINRILCRSCLLYLLQNVQWFIDMCFFLKTFMSIIRIFHGGLKSSYMQLIQNLNKTQTCAQIWYVYE